MSKSWKSVFAGLVIVASVLLGFGLNKYHGRSKGRFELLSDFVVSEIKKQRQSPVRGEYFDKIAEVECDKMTQLTLINDLTCEKIPKNKDGLYKLKIFGVLHSEIGKNDDDTEYSIVQFDLVDKKTGNIMWEVTKSYPPQSQKSNQSAEAKRKAD